MYVLEFIQEFVPEFGMNTDFYPGTNSGTNFFMSSKLRLMEAAPLVIPRTTSFLPGREEPSWQG